MSKRGLIEAALVLVVLGGLVRLAEVAPAAQGEPGAYARYGFDRLRYAWEPGAIGPDFCLSEEEGGQGFFCDGAQLAMSALKSLQDYVKFAQAVLAQPPEPIRDMVNKEFVDKILPDFTTLSRITKEQIRVKEIKNTVDPDTLALKQPTNLYFLNRNTPPPFLLEAQKDSEDCTLDLKEFHRSGHASSVDELIRNIKKNARDVVEQCYSNTIIPYSDDPLRDAVIILKASAFRESNYSNVRQDSIIDLKRIGLVPENSELLFLMSLRSFVDDFENTSRLIYLNYSISINKLLEEHTLFKVVTRNHKGMSPVQFEHARLNATVWQDPDLRGVLPGRDFSRPFTFVEVPVPVTTIDDFSGSLESTFFQDLSQRYAAAFEPVFDKILGFPSVKKTGEGPGLADVSFSAGLALPGKTISLRGTALNVNFSRSLSELDAKRGTRYADNPFLFLPLDGSLGLQDDGTLLRQGYGTDVSLSGDASACPIGPQQPWLPAAPDSRALARLEVDVPNEPYPPDPSVALTLSPLGERRFRLACYPASRPGWAFSLQALFDALRAGELSASSQNRSLTLRWNEGQ